MESPAAMSEKDFLACCGSSKFAQQMVFSGPFLNLDQAVAAARDIWFNQVDVNGWLEAFAAHPQIGESPSSSHKSPTSAQSSLLTYKLKDCQYRVEFQSTSLGNCLQVGEYGAAAPEIFAVALRPAEIRSHLLLYEMDDRVELGVCQGRKNSGTAVPDLKSGVQPVVLRSLIEEKRRWSKGEQSTALATATESTLQELYDLNIQYRKKFGFVFLICASGRSTPEILAELKNRYLNRPIVEFENAAQEQMKITELRLQKLFLVKSDVASTNIVHSTSNIVTKAEGRVSIIESHLTSAPESSATKPPQVSTRTRPPITTHVLDIARGFPAAGIEVKLESWEINHPPPVFGDSNSGKWIFQGSSTTDKDGRSGQLMNIVNELGPGIYRISFNTGKYNPDGFFPFVSIAFQVRESQKFEHFHVPLLLSPFSFSTYRGS